MPVIKLIRPEPVLEVVQSLDILRQMASQGELVGFASALIWRGGRSDLSIKGAAYSLPKLAVVPAHQLFIELAARANHEI